MRKTIPSIQALKGKEKIVALTAYTYPIAQIVDESADIILVGDSLGMVVYGMDSTLPVTLEMMINHGKAVVKASQNAVVVVDMNFGSYQESPAQGFRNAAKIISETGCQAVKLEGGAEFADTIKLLVASGIPVMGHIGMQPQSFNNYGGFKVQGQNDDAKKKIFSDAIALEKAGCFAIVIEGVKKDVADKVTEQLSIPVIGIGASVNCDGQVLVIDDVLGMTSKPPKFVQQYGSLNIATKEAVSAYASDVRNKKFPKPENCY